MSTIQFMVKRLYEIKRTGIDMINYLGLPRSTIGNWRTRKSHTYMMKLPEISTYLGVSIQELKDAADARELRFLAASSAVKSAPEKNAAQESVRRDQSKAYRTPKVFTDGKVELNDFARLAQLEAVFAKLSPEAQDELIVRARQMAQEET